MKQNLRFTHVAVRVRRCLAFVLTLTVFLNMLPTVSLATDAAAVSKSSDIEAYQDAALYGVVSGLEEADAKKAQVLLYDTVNSFSTNVDAQGAYAFEKVNAGEYYLKIEAEGYRVPEPQKVTITEGGSLRQDFAVVLVEDSDYFYQWKADDTYFGYAESAKAPEEKTVKFLDEVIYTSDSNAAEKLRYNFNILLSDEESSWSDDYASRLFDLAEGVYQYRPENPSKWILTEDEIDDDVEITYGEKGDVIRISKSTFQNAIPRKADYNGLKGTYFSNRLYHAVVRYVTKEGTDINLVDNILKKEYGCSIIVDDYEALTRGTTNETGAAFEQFKPEELLAILEMFAEMPEGFHKIENLEYLVRRIDGQKHPLYPQAAAVSWVDAEHGYIEFMEDAFLGSEVEDTFRLILHEKTHFLWAHVFSEALKEEWIRIGGWYPSESDPDGWATSKETEFVTAYSHGHNPDEDMAESVAYYVLMPDRLESRAPEKYAFIRDYIMNGEIYMAQIREDLTFEVYNLYPDYNYPGRIVGVDIDVKGQPEEDKEVTVTVTLDTGGDRSFGASSAWARICSDLDQNAGQLYDLWLHPINEDYSVLQGTFTVSKYSQKGYWYTEQIQLYDEVGNTRFSGMDQFGWKLYINNPLQDLEKPEYVKDSIHVETEQGTLEGHEVTYAHVKFKATDDAGIKDVYCEMANNTHDSYRMDQYGTYDPDTKEATITYVLTEYMQSGEYSVNYIKIEDLAGNRSGYNFYADGTGAGYPATFIFESENSDYEPPKLDVDNIIVSAYPTHPDNPNGETLVTIDYIAKDNASGLGAVSYRLLNPLGNTYFEYHYHENFYTTFFEGDPTAWQRYQISIILPEGSAPGKWGLLEMYLQDKAGNFETYNFLEIIHFKIDTEATDPVFTLSSEKDELYKGREEQITFNEKDDSKEYLWVCQNKTGKAQIDQNGVLKGLAPGEVTVYLYEKGADVKYGMLNVKVVDEAEHHYSEWTSDGEKTHSSVCDCGETITADHIWNAGDIVRPATHTAEGIKKYTCTECGETKTETVEKTPEHSYGQWKSDDEKTHSHSCECGEKETADHKWDAGAVTKEATHTEEGVKTYTCTECGAKKTESIAKTTQHSYGQWKSDDEKTHSRSCECGEKETADHKWDAGVVTKEATHTEEGVKTYTCTECKATKTEIIAKIPESSEDILGDVDYNGEVDSSDALLVLKFVVKIQIPDKKTSTIADVDNNGEVETLDALLILKKVVKLIDEFPVNGK